MIDNHPFLVVVPRTAVDETTLGEWLEAAQFDYHAETRPGRSSAGFEIRFAERHAADACTRQFVVGQSAA